jgi:predicted ATPase/class 3 adenylate cyclase
MKCPKCQFDNPEGAKFCVECGNKLELVCPDCGSGNSPNFKFCYNCGKQLTSDLKEAPNTLSSEEKINKIQKYLPKGITEKILAQKDKIEGERKQVTVMFCDMQGYTGLSEKIDPEEVYSIMDQVYEILIHKVHNYEGTVNEMTGDGIMALFGAPIALEDAPQRAIRSAYAIHREISRFNDKMKQEKKDVPQIKMRIGIHTGPVVVGTLGNDLRVEFKAVGDTVNLASRMEGLAEPGSTYVTEETYKLTEGLFRCEALDELSIKGKEKPVRTYRVISPSTSRTRFDVSAERGLTPFVGRNRELDLLLDGFERSKAGRGQAFSIIAEAGVGKSRLLYEFRKAVANEDVTFQEGKCLSYSRDVTYHPVIDIVKSNFDIKEGDEDYDIREKLKRGLNVLRADEASTLPYLLELLSVKDSGVDTKTLSPEAIKDRIIEAIVRMPIKASQIRPLILAIEDLHWIDKSSENVFKAVLDSIAGEKVFLIFTYRPEFVHTWGAKSYHSQANLNRLSNRESLAMVAHLLGTDEVSSDLEGLILEKTEGIPFFIEEYVASFKDLKIIERKGNRYHLAQEIHEVTIPSTIQDVIMARVDALPQEAKELLQAGSAIEREFSFELIKKVTGLPETELLSSISVLKDAELFFERGIYPNSSLIFKHALTRDVVYNSLLIQKKKKLHEGIGIAIEDSYKEKLNEYYEILVEHFILSNNYEKGSFYAKLAAKKAEKAASFADAISYGKKRTSCLEQLPVDDNLEKKIIDSRTILGLYYLQIAHLIEAKAAVDPIVDLAIKRNYKRRISQIFCILGHYHHWVEEDYPKALEYLEKALEIGTESEDILCIFMANLLLAFCLSDNCEFDKTLHHYTKALEINEMANVLWGIATLKTDIVCFVYLRQGNIKHAYRTSEEALSIANESNDVYSKAHAYLAYGMSCYLNGYLKEAEEYILKAINFAETINQLAVAAASALVLGGVYYYMGKHKTSQNYYEKAISYYRNGELLPSYANFCKIGIAKANLINNNKEIRLNEISKCYEDIKSKWARSMGSNYIGEILLNIDDQHISEAENWIKKSIETNQKYGMKWNLAQDYALYSEFYKRKSELLKAKEALSTAIEIFKECGADGWIERYEKDLVALS